MDRWKMKELKQMELGGNKNAQEYYEQFGMIKDGKPDHEAAPHAKYKMELSQKAEAALKSMMPSQQPAQQVSKPAEVQLTQPMLSNTFDLQISETKKEVLQAQLQAVEIPQTTNSAILAPAKKTQTLQMQAPSTGGMSFAKKQETTVKALGSKKLDFNFESEDFFNSFQPTPVSAANSNQLIEISGNNTLLKTNDPFEMASKPVIVRNGPEISKQDEEAAREKLKKMGNRKAISSDDFFTDNSKSAEIEQKFQELKASGATQISSEMMFGRQSEPEKPQPSMMEAFEQNLMGRTSMGSGGSYDEYKEAASRVAEQIGNKAFQVKSAAMDWFSQFTQQ